MNRTAGLGGTGDERRFSFRVTVLALFSTLVIVVAGGAVYTQHQMTRGMALDASERILAEVNRSVIERTETLFQPLLLFATTMSELPEQTARPMLSMHPAAPVILSFLEQHPWVASAYLGFDDGGFFQAVNLVRQRQQLLDVMQAPSSARFALRVILPAADGRRIELLRFLDAQWQPVGSSKAVQADYDPRGRPWYRQAVGYGATVVTDFYPFHHEPGVGITVARGFDGDAVGVLGIDLTLSSMSRFLESRKNAAFGEGVNGTIFLFTADGRLLAHSNPLEVSSPTATPQIPFVQEAGDALTASVYDRFVRMQSETHLYGGPESMVADGTRYAVQYSGVPLPNGEEAHLALAMDLGPFLAPMERAQRRTLLLTLAIVLGLMPLVYVGSAWVSRPLRALAGVVHDIRQLRLGGPRVVGSRIREIDDLATALQSMKETVASFGKYVPQFVVREIVENNRLPTVGGEVREVVVLFSDIQGFTPWSQSVPPEELMATMSRYLSGMADLIEARDGVVDKFVGDAVMAYWNAPAAVDDPIEKACLAVLGCRAFADRFAAGIATDGLAAGTFFTRFGLHVGEATVGNVGSSRRMDFTVMGAPINVGSRLEPLNKYYGTQVLVSAAVAENCGHRFLFRWVDSVQPVGALQPMDVFELVGAREEWEAAPRELVATPEDVERCHAWENVRRLYLDREWRLLLAEVRRFVGRFGEEPLAKVYRDRAERFVADPPAADWDFVTLYLTKR